MLSAAEAQDIAARLKSYHEIELESLDPVYAYWTGRQTLPVVPRGVPKDVQRLAQMSRINILALVVSLQAQGLYVDGYRTASGENEPAWEAWQANNMDHHQTGIHRAALAYGTDYVIVLPGDPYPVIRGVSPRSLVAMYDESSGDWPYYALEKVQSPWSATEYRLYDADAVYTLHGSDTGDQLALRGVETHELGICPVVRYRNQDTLNEPPLKATMRSRWLPTRGITGGEIEPLMSLQDQLDVTTFDLLVAQRFQSFRQRYVMGWTADSEEEKAKANASSLWTFEDPDTKVGEFGQVDLSGYLDSRQATVTAVGVTAQAPPHELLGSIANLSAEALAAASVGERRKRQERQSLFGESHEQTFWLTARAGGMDEPDRSAQVIWRDTEARSLGQIVDALGKMASQLHMPVELLWERLPGFTQQDLERGRQLLAQGDSLRMLAELLDRQAGEPEPRPSPRPPLLPVA